MIEYRYFWICLSGFIFLIWLLLVVLNRVHRKAFLFGLPFMIAGPICEFISIPEYWNPHTMFAFIIETPLRTWYFGPEDIISSLALSGIGFGLFEIFHKNRTGEKIGFSWRGHRNFFFWISIGLVIISVLYFGLGISGINSTNLGMFITALIFYVFNIRYLQSGLITSLVISGSYWLILRVVFLPLFPEMFTTVWTESGNSGIYLLGVPLDEVLWAACYSFLGGPMYRVAFNKTI